MIGETHCTGIGAPECAAPFIDWSLGSEVDDFARAVCFVRYGHKDARRSGPGSPLWGDFTTLRIRHYRRFNIPFPDLIVAGTPCQAFSIAGLRKGLADPRGNLTIAFVRHCHATANAARHAGRKPPVIVWENVPGVLSDTGNAFGCFLGAIVGADDPLHPPAGSSWPRAGMAEGPRARLAWRLLDAQYFGLAQRRLRVFVVIDLGSGIDPAAILFEPESLSGNPPPRRQAGKDVAQTISARPSGGGGLGTDFDLDGGLIASTGNTAHCLNAGGMGRQDYETETLIAHALRGEGFDASEDGTGRGVPIVAQRDVLIDNQTLYSGGVRQGCYNASPQKTNAGTLLRSVCKTLGKKAFAEWGFGILDSLQPPEILRQALHGGEFRPTAFSRSWVVHCALSREEDRGRWAVQSLWEARCTRRSPPGWGPSEQRSRQLGAYLSELSQPGPQPERFMLDLWEAAEGLGVLRQALSAVQKIRRPVGGESKSAPTHLSVRRLTAEECEFLQGFPRGFTNITWRGKPASDGRRYKAIGNSMAIPVVRWVLNRIREYEAAE